MRSPSGPAKQIGKRLFLINLIYVNLDVPFNPDFAYFDQSFTLSVHPHPFAGMTDLKTGDDIPDFGYGPV